MHVDMPQLLVATSVTLVTGVLAWTARTLLETTKALTALQVRVDMHDAKHEEHDERHAAHDSRGFQHENRLTRLEVITSKK